MTATDPIPEGFAALAGEMRDAVRVALTPPVYTLAELRARPELMTPPAPLVAPILSAGRITMLSGREKAGKSTFAAAMVAALSAGRPFLGRETAPSSVLWYALDEPYDDTVRRFDKLGARDELVRLSWERPTLEHIREHLTKVQPALVVVDVLRALLGAGTNFNRAEEVYPKVERLCRLLRNAGVAGLLMHHATKSRGEYSGAVELAGAVDAVLTFRRLRGKANDDPPPDPEDDEADDTPDDGRRIVEGSSRWGQVRLRVVSPDGLGYELSSQKAPLQRRALWLFADEGPHTITEARQKLGGRTETASLTIRAMVADGLLRRREDGHHEVTEKGRALRAVA